jgi:hypothetical protein
MIEVFLIFLEIVQLDEDLPKEYSMLQIDIVLEYTYHLWIPSADHLMLKIEYRNIKSIDSLLDRNDTFLPSNLFEYLFKEENIRLNK